MLLIAKVIGQALVAVGEFAVEQLVGLVRRATRKGSRDSLPEVDVAVSEPPQPLTFKDVERIRAQERASIEASKAAMRSAATPKPDTLPKK